MLLKLAVDRYNEPSVANYQSVSSPACVLNMIFNGGELPALPRKDLLSLVLGEDNGVPEDRKLWVDGEDEHRFLTKSQARKQVGRLSHGYRQAGLVRDRNGAADVVISFSENQLIGFVSTLAVLAARGIVATCPSQATSNELGTRVAMLKPTAVICSRTTVEVARETQRLTTSPFEIVIQDSTIMDVCDERGRSYLSHQTHEWRSVERTDDLSKPAFLIFSSGTSGLPKGSSSPLTVWLESFWINETLFSCRTITTQYHCYDPSDQIVDGAHS
jgi:acyl-coenzyme A synthetase/AMP-(fatty) acid ligase